MSKPELLAKRRFARESPYYRSIRCALCYKRLRPWQARAQGANYFPHPYMTVHLKCGKAYESKPVRIVAVLGPDGRDSGKTTIGREISLMEHGGE